jgi:hypothetical protein
MEHVHVCVCAYKGVAAYMRGPRRRGLRPIQLQNLSTHLDCCRRLRADRHVCWSASTPNAATAAVEQDEAHTMCLGHTHNLLLRFKQRPGGSHTPSILARVRVTCGRCKWRF